MGWAEERASKIVDQMRGERPSLTIGRQEEIIAAALQKVADECADTLWERVGREQYGHAKAAVALDIEAIRARFPKEGR